jgi:hypothetical protein
MQFIKKKSIPDPATMILFLGFIGCEEMIVTQSGNFWL